MQKTTDDEQRNVAQLTEIEAERIAEAFESEVDEMVHPRNWPGKDHDVIVVEVPSSRDGRVNPYSKARIINDVFNSSASVELHSTEDGEKIVTFKPNA